MLAATTRYHDPVTDIDVSPRVSLGIKVPDVGVRGEYVHVDFTLTGDLAATVDLFLSDLHSFSTYPVADHVSVHQEYLQAIVIIPLKVHSGTYQFVATKVGDVSVEYARSNDIAVHSSTSGRIKVPEHGRRGTPVSVEFNFPEGGPTNVNLFLWEQNLGEHLLIIEDMRVERGDPYSLDIPLQVDPGQYQVVATTGEERTIYAGSNIITID